MTRGLESSPIDDAELLARFIFSNRCIRADGTVKPDAFMPPRSLELSVSRHLASTQAQVWERGRQISRASARALIGRADVSASDVRATVRLNAVPAPISEDPSHAHVVGWPPETSAQKLLALQLAARSFSARP